MIKIGKTEIVNIIKNEIILIIAIVIAIISCIFVHPDSGYMKYIDYRTIAILFSLMVVMEGYKKIGVFECIAEELLSKSNNITYIVFVLMALCFFFSMLITNDVALITFVPFSFTILNKMSDDVAEKLLIPIVVIQTVAANLGSMLTPIGNPQNLYLYGISEMSPGRFVHLMAPYSMVGFCVLLITIMIICRNQGKTDNRDDLFKAKSQIDPSRLIAYSAMFFLCILSVLRILDYRIVLGIIVVAIVITDVRNLKKVDYSLLLTFIFFFIFVGNVGRIGWFFDKLSEFVSGSELLVSIAVSQIISNVPAALLLSDFTNNYDKLIVGLNIAGFGTLIASMASLISFRQIAREKNELKWKYLIRFTLYNLIVFISMILVYYIGKNTL